MLRRGDDGNASGDRARDDDDDTAGGGPVDSLLARNRFGQNFELAAKSMGLVDADRDDDDDFDDDDDDTNGTPAAVATATSPSFGFDGFDSNVMEIRGGGNEAAQRFVEQLHYMMDSV